MMKEIADWFFIIDTTSYNKDVQHDDFDCVYEDQSGNNTNKQDNFSQIFNSIKYIIQKFLRIASQKKQKNYIFMKGF